MARIKHALLLAALLAIPSCVDTPAKTTETKADLTPAGLAINTPNMPKLAKKGDIEDRIEFYPGDDESVYVTVMNPSGIGHVVLDRVGTRWPPMMIIVLSHDPGHHFSHAESVVVTDQDKKVVFTSEKNVALPVEWTVPDTVKADQLTITWNEASP